MIFKSKSSDSAFKVIPVEEKVFIFVGSYYSGKSFFGRTINNAIIVDDVTVILDQKNKPIRPLQLEIRKHLVEFKLGKIAKWDKTGLRSIDHPEDSILIFITNDFTNVTTLHSMISEVLQDIYDGYITSSTKGIPGMI